MKGINFFTVFVLALTIVLSPLAVLKNDKSSKTLEAGAGFVSMPQNTVSSQQNAEKEFRYNTYVRLYDQETETTKEIDLREYIYGVVAGECPMLYHEEAIKAQIVAAKTYTLYRMKANAGEEYDVTTDPETSQNYISKEKAYENWGSKAETYDQKLNDLIDEVYDYCIFYKDSPILAVYHAMSAGKTEDCKYVWNTSLDYLKPVLSDGDKLADGYLSEQKVTIAEANGILKAKGVTAAELSKGETDKTESGNVIKITVGEIEITGAEISRLFSLRSNNFDIELGKKNIVFTVRGYGHQVGMSQNGANYLAKQGKSYDEILTHYYSGTEVAKFVEQKENQ